jgi:hypothetical protein
MEGATKIMNFQVHDFASEQKSRLLQSALKKGRTAFFQQPAKNSDASKSAMRSLSGVEASLSSA